MKCLQIILVVINLMIFTGNSSYGNPIMEIFPEKNNVPVGSNIDNSEETSSFLGERNDDTIGLKTLSVMLKRSISSDTDTISNKENEDLTKSDDDDDDEILMTAYNTVFLPSFKYRQISSSRRRVYTPRSRGYRGFRRF